jgi:hypothetical protein
MDLFIAQTVIKKLETGDRGGVGEEKLEDNEWMRWEKARMDEKGVEKDEAREQEVMQEDIGRRRQKRWLYEDDTKVWDKTYEKRMKR